MPGAGAKVEIVDMRPEHAEAFRRLNLEWITLHWELEDADRLYLDHPVERIIEPGGAVLIALYEGEPVGTVALIPLEDGRYELAKMAVAERARGKGIGQALGSAAIDRARRLGAPSVYLETNSILEPAIRLYRKLGFQPAAGRVSPYCRCDVHMELPLTDAGTSRTPPAED